jgi:hypothetical protein
MLFFKSTFVLQSDSGLQNIFVGNILAASCLLGPSYAKWNSFLFGLCKNKRSNILQTCTAIQFLVPSSILNQE